MNFRLTKNERVFLKKDLDELFEVNNNHFIYPFKIHWFYRPDEKCKAKFFVSVPKKKFKSAVARNLIKRRVKEAYRLNKHLLTKQPGSEGKCLYLALVYIASDPLDYHTIENKVKAVLVSNFK